MTHIVPVCSTHFEATGPPLGLFTRRASRAIAHDIGEGVASFPVTRADALISVHHILLREIVP